MLQELLNTQFSEQADYSRKFSTPCDDSATLKYPAYILEFYFSRRLIIYVILYQRLFPEMLHLGNI